MIAYVDESMRQGGDGLYVVTAAVIVKARSEDIRDAMRGLLLPGQRRLHWHDEGEERRHEILKVIGDMAAGSDLMACVYWHTPTPKPKQERARNLCLRAFLGELLNTAPTEVVIESRGYAPALQRAVVVEKRVN
ncbi:MAG: hypothetical protein ABI635_07195 [Actinomycetota bacterium]